MSVRQIRRCDFPQCAVSIELPEKFEGEDATFRLAGGYGITTPRGWTSVQASRRATTDSRHEPDCTQGDVPIVHEFCPRHREMGVQTLLDDKSNLYLIIVRVPETP